MEKVHVVFSQREKLFLIELVANEKEIVENKKTDGTTIKLKNEAWERITTCFNGQGFSKRTAKQLRKCWENLKQRKRKINTQVRQERLLTGGGPPKKVPDDPVLDFVEAAAPHLDVEIRCPYDSTAVFEAQNNLELHIEAAPEVQQEPPSVEVLPRVPLPGSSNAERGSVTITPRLKKRIFQDVEDLKTGRELKIKKLKDSILHQEELQRERMKTTKVEYNLAKLKVIQQLAKMKAEGILDPDFEIDFDNIDVENL